MANENSNIIDLQSKKQKSEIIFTSIQKRDGRIVPFDKSKITGAVFSAAQAVGGDDKSIAEEITNGVIEHLYKMKGEHIPNVEEVQDAVEKILIETGHAKTAKAYILYRDKRTRMREAKSELMDIVEDILKETNRENANLQNSPSAKLVQIGSTASKRYYLSRLIPEEFSLLHINGDIHIHDLDNYAKTICNVTVDLKTLLSNGFRCGYGNIRPAKRAVSAIMLATVITQSVQNEIIGGVCFPDFDSNLAPFLKEAPEKEINQAAEAFIFNCNNMYSRAGSQLPFLTINLGMDVSDEGRGLTRAILLAVENGLGNGETPVSPNVVFKLKRGVNLEPSDPNYDLFRLAMRTSSYRLNPTYSFMDATFNSSSEGKVTYLGCGTRICNNLLGETDVYGRGIVARTSINLPKIALLSHGNVEKFFMRLSYMIDVCGEQLQHRFRVLSKLRKKDLPFLMGEKVFSGSRDISDEDSIDPSLRNGLFAIGLVGLAEALIALEGKHHGESGNSQKLGLNIVNYMSERIFNLREKYKLNFVLYSPPAETLCGKFLQADRKQFGTVQNITSMEYYTNSFHVPSRFRIPAIEKIETESPYHMFVDGGHISSIEFGSAPKNKIDVIENALTRFLSANAGYCALSYPVDECSDCGFSVPQKDSNCPRCASKRINRMRKVAGYMAKTDRLNPQKYIEIKDRTPNF